MKAFVGLMKFATTIVTLVLVVMLVIAILPIAAGGISPGETTDMTATVEDGELRLTGGLSIMSSLSEDVEDVRIRMYSQSGSGTLEIMDSTVTLTAGGATDVPIDVRVPIAEAVVYMINVNADKDVPGIGLPVTISIDGTYFHRMLGFGFALDYEVPLSESGTISVDSVRNSAGEVSRVDVSISGLSESDMMFQFIPEDTQEATVSVGGSEVTVSLGRTGDSAKVTVSGGDALRQTLDALLDAAEAGEEITFQYAGETVAMTADGLEDLVSALRDLVDRASEAGVI